MVHLNRTLRSASSHTASNTAISTAAPSSPQKPLPQRAKRTSTTSKSSTGSTFSTTSPVEHSIEDVHNGENQEMQHDIAIVARPPTRLSLANNTGALHQTTNGVITDLELCQNNVAEIAEASVANFETVITKDVTPAPTDKDKRVLRSQDVSSRSKSSLARFFPDFEEVVFGVTKEPELLTADTILFVFEPKLRESAALQFPSETKMSRDGELHTSEESSKVTIPANPAAPDNVPVMDFSPFEIEASNYDSDPLADAMYLQAHKRGERKEKQLRNIEKEHALHEKSDLERVLEELRGPDWLKVMGISGVTEMERKRYEPYRDQYILRAKALLDKFTLWKEQERVLKLRREEALMAKEEVEDEDDEDPEEHKDSSFAESHSYSIDLIDASARQLQLEAKSAYNPLQRARVRTSTKLYLPLPELGSDEPFVSFYSKPHLRAAAVGGYRRGRTATAFGQPIPEIPQEDFVLPEDYITQETVIANARKRRRLKRESNVKSAT